ncbi:DUF5103 domain-containing protein [Hymenobacter oligotrophus]|uniref:DUF5103 domain-containing protein n=1 Tax=Hymenobacter oligotrophus TaxID=2319843 RepID=A0A3B7QWG1_9BACT|nr:DUF5103 domain-containing protein [Hymenobacter oligotrophus]AYA35875.1 DUF5103 domain-containing protein [Hymenobacter oligotrophus]
MLRRSAISLLLLASAACVPLGTPITDPNAGRPGQGSAVQVPRANQQLRFEDATYDPDVQSVQCYASTGQPTEVFNPPVVPLASSGSMVLEFDILGNQSRRLTARLVHCNADWSPSVLTDLQFLNEINEFNLTQYRTSVGTQVPYFHYRLAIPPVKLSGNFLLVVQDGTTRQPLLSRRLLVFENLVEVAAQLGLAPGGSARYTMQQIDFAIRYGNYPLVNPAVETKVVMRQNFRWDNAKYNLRPTFVRDAEQQLDYQYFNFENAFPAFNEFRFADLRSLRTAGVGVAQLNTQSSPREVLLLPEETRTERAYTQYEDADGQRVFESREYGNGATNADYVWTTFQLRAPSVAPGPVYVFGALTDWKLKDDFKLTYNAAQQLYTGRALLKQGYYNYYYVVGQPNGAAPDAGHFEGSYQLTQNQYDILVYYRPPGTRTDLLIGYRPLTVNGAQVRQSQPGLFRR